MQPFYIPNPAGELYAVYHQPRPGPARQCAVLLCYPLGHEYLNAHRAYRQIASQLSAEGYPVLRFDYLGCGDSGGSSEHARVEDWLENVTQAVAELRAKSRATRLCVIGLRLGATLALQAAARIGPVEGLALWDPIVNGQDYLQELARFHKRVLDMTESISGSAARPAAYDGLSLFGFGAGLQQQLGAIDLLSVQGRPAKHVLLLHTGGESEDHPLAGRLEQQGAWVQCKQIPVDAAWQKGYDSLLLPGQALPTVVRWVCEVCA